MVWFYGILAHEGYLMPNPVYTYLLDINNLQTHFVKNIFE